MRKLAMGLLAGLLVLAAAACSPAGAGTAADEQQEQTGGGEGEQMATEPIDNNYVKKDGIDVIYLAGGCFWGTEQLMQSIPGVVNVTSGYANGTTDDPTYQQVVTGQTGYRETVRVEYDPEAVSLDTILFMYYAVIDPTVENQQGNDRGTQYQTGVYYADEAGRQTVERITEIAKGRTDEFVVEIGPLTRFYDAEEYHQDYLVKNPDGYCHIPAEEMELAAQIVVDAGDYPRPSEEEIEAALPDFAFQVTQGSGTEPAFENAYWDNHEAGIYVDVVTGEPLFSSSSKFDSGTGWPSFFEAIDPNTLVLLRDTSLGMERTEVRSRTGDTHLGHVFFGEAGVPNGVRYCMNSASLRFVPREDMEAEGYGYLIDYVQ